MVTLLLLALFALGPTGQDTDVVRRVDAILDAWLAGEHASADQTERELAAVGKSAMAYLCILLDERPRHVPAEAIAAVLSRSRLSSAVPTLGRLTGSSSRSERLSAVDGLFELELRACVPYLVNAVEDADDAVASRARAHLLGSKKMFPWVVQAVEDRLAKTEDLGRQARFLGALGHDAAHELLMELLGASDEPSKLAAMEGLWIMKRTADGAHVRKLVDWSQSEVIKKKACLLLGRLRYRPATRDLIELLYETDSGVRANAHWALKNITGLQLKGEAELWETWWERSGKNRTD